MIIRCITSDEKFDFSNFLSSPHFSPTIPAEHTAISRTCPLSIGFRTPLTSRVW